MYFSDHYIDYLIEEDYPGYDLTSSIIDFHTKNAEIIFTARHDTILSGSEPASKVLEKVGCKIKSLKLSGSKLKKGDIIIDAEGSPNSVHAGWRIALNLIEYSSGIAERTSNLVNAARKNNENIQICGTRKSFPGTRKLSANALIAGGGIPHRLGLGETVLFFEEHYKLSGGIDTLLENVHILKIKSPEKKLAVEVKNYKDAVGVAKAGFDIIQIDKLSPEEISEIVAEVKAIDQKIKISAAGGINISNAEAYAVTGVDMLVTSWMYFGKPADIQAEIHSKG